MAFLEQCHNCGVFRVVEPALQVVELTNRLVIQVAVLVALQECHGELVHWIVRPVLLALNPGLEEVDEAAGGHVGAFVELLYLVALHLDLEVSLLHGEAHLGVAPLQLSVLCHCLAEGGQLREAILVQPLHLDADSAHFRLHALHHLGPDALVSLAAASGLW